MEENLVKCPVCKGWGSKELPLKKSFSTCEFCDGESVQLYSEDFYVSWDIPPFIDYGQRYSNKIKKILAISIPSLAALVLVIVLITLLINIFN